MLIEAKKLIEDRLTELEDKTIQYYNHGIKDRTIYIRAVIEECSGNLSKLVDTEKVYMLLKNMK